MIFSFDIGIKNFGIYAENDEGYPILLLNKNLYPYTADNFITFLDELFDNKTPTTVLVERQLYKNHIMYKIFSHLEIYIKIKFKKCQFVICDAKHKDVPKNLDYKNRKKSAVDIATKYLKSYNDNNLILNFNSNKKKDDIGDAICQLIYYLDKKFQI